jgi:ferric-dicitrate binding protein FerR (iron transport regulator)
MKAPLISPELLEKYLLDQCSDQEKEEVEAWYAALKGEQKYLETLPEPEQQAMKENAFENIKANLELPERTQETPFPWRWISGVAASVAIVAGIYFNYPKTRNERVSAITETQLEEAGKVIRFVNSEQKVFTHILPDSSSITMLPEASVTYPLRFEAKKRSVTFSGEGFFNIKKDKSRPFLIQSGEMVIKVLGTSFNVKAASANKVFQVDVMTGSVEVTTPDRELKPQQIVLKPQQQAIFEINSKRLTAKAITTHSKKEIYEPATITFEETPLNKVIEQLEKRFDVEIKLSDPTAASCSVTANFEAQPFTEILEMLCATLEGSYTIAGKNISIKAEPCE